MRVLLAAVGVSVGLQAHSLGTVAMSVISVKQSGPEVDVSHDTIISTRFAAANRAKATYITAMLLALFSLIAFLVALSADLMSGRASFRAGPIFYGALIIMSLLVFWGR